MQYSLRLVFLRIVLHVHHRKQIENGEFPGVEIICTRNRADTVQFLIRQLERFIESFDPVRPPTKTMEQLRLHIHEEMNNPTFLEYLRLRKQPGIGDVKAMKVGYEHFTVYEQVAFYPTSTHIVPLI